MEYEEQKPKEPMDLLENVKEELIENEHSELIIPKQEIDNFLENVKEEPIDVEFFDQIVPKLEESIDPSASYTFNSLMQKSSIETQDDVPNIYVEPRKKSWKRCRCSVCLHIHITFSTKYVTIEGDKLVVMVGLVLRGDFSVDRAQSFMSKTKNVYICYFHFSEAINEIYKVLNLNDIAELTSRSSDLVDNLMFTVNTICPQIETWRFCDNLHKFVGRNISRKRKYTKAIEEQSEKQKIRRCSVCTQEKRYNNIKQVTLQEEKLVIMMGCILRGEYTLEQAHSFISLQKSPLICHIHFPEALNAIYKALKIGVTSFGR